MWLWMKNSINIVSSLLWLTSKHIMVLDEHITTTNTFYTLSSFCFVDCFFFVFMNITNHCFAANAMLLPAEMNKPISTTYIKAQVIDINRNAVAHSFKRTIVLIYRDRMVAWPEMSDCICNHFGWAHSQSSRTGQFFLLLLLLLLIRLLLLLLPQFCGAHFH